MLGIAGPGDLRRQIETAQVLDTPLRRDQTAELARHPPGNLAPTPDAAIRRRFADRVVEMRQLGRIQKRHRAGIVVAAVAQPIKAVIVVAP